MTPSSDLGVCFSTHGTVMSLFGHFGKRTYTQNYFKFTLKSCNRRSDGPSIDEYLDSEYHTKVPWLPDVLRDNDTDDFLAWKWGCIAVKASTCFLLQFL